MEQYITLLKTIEIFKNSSDITIKNIIRCLDGYTKVFSKDQIIYNYYDKIEYAGIVLEGEVTSVILNSSGNEYTLKKHFSGDVFAESYACLPSEFSFVQLISKGNSKILFLKLSNLFKNTAIHCPYASNVTSNLLKIISRSNIFQDSKLQIVTQKHIRDKIIMYINHFHTNNNTIFLPFNRQQFANYLGVDRSALSRELSRMKDEKLINYSKNKIELLNNTINKRN